jgi:hypothetical protein
VLEVITGDRHFDLKENELFLIAIHLFKSVVENVYLKGNAVNRVSLFPFPNGLLSSLLSFLHSLFPRVLEVSSLSVHLESHIRHLEPVLVPQNHHTTWTILTASPRYLLFHLCFYSSLRHFKANPRPHVISPLNLIIL